MKQNPITLLFIVIKELYYYMGLLKTLQFMKSLAWCANLLNRMFSSLYVPSSNDAEVNFALNSFVVQKIKELYAVRCNQLDPFSE